MGEFEREQVMIKDLDKVNHPQLFKTCAGRRDPLATMEYYLNQDEERKCLNLLVKLASRHRIRPNTYEFDGLTGCGVGRLIDASAKEGLMVSMKPMPHTMEDLLQTARDKHPNHGWSLDQDLD